MTHYKFDEQAVAEYYERRKQYIKFGLNPYQNAEYVFSISKPIVGTILEVGTGRGLVTSFFARETALVTVDIDKEIQSFAKALTKSESVFDNITFLIRDILKEPYPDNSFNMVISANAVHHFEEPEKIITAMCKIAERKVVIADFSQEGFDILDKIHKAEGDTHGRGTFSIDEVGEVMIKMGFKTSRHEKLQTIVYCGEK